MGIWYASEMRNKFSFGARAYRLNGTLIVQKTDFGYHSKTACSRQQVEHQYLLNIKNKTKRLKM